MYEHKKQGLAPLRVYYRRILRNLLIASAIIFLCLVIGVAGYHYTCRIGWLDSLHNASMILSGMGPVLADPVHIPDAGKWFSSLYALFSGVVFITNIGILLFPVIHRLFHKFHLEEK